MKQVLRIFMEIFLAASASMKEEQTSPMNLHNKKSKTLYSRVLLNTYSVSTHVVRLINTYLYTDIKRNYLFQIQMKHFVFDTLYGR